ncbi:hypothetical protein HBZS_111680 [Helicobacter bizzozeronii CCUG 35545]|nr:hypothetical protein HBZS_111680 [Helicobacter bizzozeronii CCUG 35545]
MDGVLGGRCCQHGRSGVKSPLGLVGQNFLPLDFSHDQQPVPHWH